MEQDREPSEPAIVVDVTLPPPAATHENNEARPRRVSIKKIDRMIKRRETRWFQRHIAPLYDLIEARTIDTTTLLMYARLWQIERWLRDLLQLELQAAYGPSWTAHCETALSRQSYAAAPNAYMASVDDKNPLAYADLDNLGDILRDQWRLVGYAFPPKARWNGILETLLPIRNRIGHCRQANQRDLGRLEDALRDLTPGARKACTSYADREFIDESYGVLDHWNSRSPKQHHLVAHADRNYQTTVRLRISHRPWADCAVERSGELLHVQFRSNNEAINIGQLAEDLDHIEGVEELIHIDVTSSHNIDAVLSRGADTVLDDVIETLLHLVLGAEGRTSKGTLKECRRWCASDYRIRFEDYFAWAADMSRADIFRLES
jgi:hypothetical protein